jgi:hypothetical protein
VEDATEFTTILQRLETEYGIHHNDTNGGRNMIVITDPNGAERVVAIDFEDWEDVQEYQ